MPERKRGSLG